MITADELKNKSYCCAECNDTCFIYKATVENDLEAKKQIAAFWTQEQGEEFTVDEAFCYGCKKEGMPQNKAHLKCTVRLCAIEKHFESCAQCTDLEKCDKMLWRNWPNVKIEALRIQEKLKK